MVLGVLDWRDHFAREFGFPVSQLLDAYGINGDSADVERIAGGRIHDSLSLKPQPEQAGKAPPGYFAQRLNAQVFPDLNAVMDNVALVSDHLWQQQKNRHNNRETVLRLHATRFNEPLWHDPNGHAWRLFDLIEDAATLGANPSREQIAKAAKAFGRFVAAIDDLDPARLKITLPGFHDTEGRYRSLMDAAEKTKLNDADAEQTEILLKIAEANHDLTRLCADQPLRIVHNDTKLNNVLFKSDLSEPLCVVDLDTVMPGYLAHDFGDLVRSALNPVSEDESLQDTAVLDIDRFMALANGYLAGIGEKISADERHILALAPQLMAYELGMRFLADHLMGDLYFGVEKRGDNLRRAANQFTLMRLMQTHEADMALAIVKHR